MLPGTAVVALEEGRWQPSSFAYPSGDFDVLRGVYELAYWVGRATGAYRDRLDLVAAYFTEPFRFVLVPRIWSCLTGVATVVVTTLLAMEMFGPACGATALTPLGRIPPKVATMLSRDADVVARFVGYDPANVARMLFEPIDASAYPLRGIAAVDRPGPNVTIYRLRARSTSPSTTGSSAPPTPLP